MQDGISRIVSIIEDRALWEIGLRIIMEAAETKELPTEASLPVFNDVLTNETFIAVLEKITGKTY